MTGHTQSRRQIGTVLLRRLLARLDRLYVADLMCDATLRGYYARFDMAPLTGDAAQPGSPGRDPSSRAVITAR